jgi:signal transduction histidine kinase
MNQPSTDQDSPTDHSGPRTEEKPFRPRARLLVLLGDQLIREPGIAVFELVKNAYDADARNVSVALSNPTEAEKGSIVVEDDGIGMDWETVVNVWLEPGTDHRLTQKAEGFLTPRFKRRPLGEKGIGRFAAHKLGKSVTLVSRKKPGLEIVVHIDWSSFEKETYLQDVKIKVQERPPVVFTGDRSGTRVEVSALRQTWTKTTVRDLHRSVVSICSPFGGPDSFKVGFSVSPHEEWLDDLIDAETASENALFFADCHLEHDSLTYRYHFRPLSGMKGLLPRDEVVDSTNPARMSTRKGPIDLDDVKLGPFDIQLQIFDREPAVLALGAVDKKGLKEYLDQNGGIRVYRDGVRVYDYGEQGNDWLGLDVARVNIPVRRLSNNIVLGAVVLSSSASSPLVEKTNREGFVENDAYRVFVSSVRYAIAQIAAARNKDKLRIRTITSSPSKSERVLWDIGDLRQQIHKDPEGAKLTKLVDRIEEDYLEIRDRLLTAAGSGLSLAVVVHEVEKGVLELSKAVARDVEVERVRALAVHLSELIKGLGYLTKRNPAASERLGTLVDQALFNTEYRLKYHNIRVVRLEAGSPDTKVKCTRRLIVSTLMNLIDNSIYWLDNRWGGFDKGSGEKAIFISISDDYPAPSIIVADNGTGFRDPPEDLTQPGMTRKPDGSGLGLHIASEVMRANKGRLDFPEHHDVTLPSEATGAVVALVFGEEK